MRILRWLGRLIAGIWQLARVLWIDHGQNLRFGSGANRLYVFLFLVFLLIGLVLVLFGFDLGDVDAFLEAQGGWLEALGDRLFRIAAGLVLLLCIAMVGLQVFARREEKPGLGCAIAAVVIGYFAWFGTFADL